MAPNAWSAPLSKVRPVTPNSEGCEECLAGRGPVGAPPTLPSRAATSAVCDSSKNKHATKTLPRKLAHPVIKSAEPGEEWGWCYVDEIMFDFRVRRGAGRTQKTHHRDREVKRTWPKMLDCLVSYFSEDANADGLPNRYLAYHVVAGPGPIPDGRRSQHHSVGGLR